MTDEELQRALVGAAAPVPRPGAAVSTTTATTPRRSPALRAPIFEEKVVDFLLELAKVTDKTVSREELLREDEDERADLSARPGA